MDKDDLKEILKQTSITSFFKPCRGPLKFDLKPLPKRIIKPKKRRSKKKKVIIESDNSDVEIIEDTIKQEPLSPKIIFENDLEYLEFSSGSCGTMEGSPAKKSKRNNTENSSHLMNITITKSSKQVKELSKLSRTLLVNTSTETTITYSLLKSDLIDNDITIAPGITQYIEADVNCDMSQFLVACDSEILEITNKIKKQIELLKIILKNSIRPNNEHLLFEEEKNVLVSFLSIHSLLQFICCKLFTHQIKWYNAKVFMDNLHIPLKSDKLPEVVKELQDKSLIVTDYRKEKLVSLLNLLYSDDLKKIYKALRINTKARSKEQYIDDILKHVRKQPTLNPLKGMDTVVKNMACEKLGNLIKISPILYKTLYKVHLMYSFTNSDLQIPGELYRFMGMVRYENPLPAYEIRNDVIFETPKEFDDYYKAFSYREELAQEFDKKQHANMKKICDLIYTEFKTIIDNDFHKSVKPGFLNRFTAGSKYASALAFGIEYLNATFPIEAKVWLEALLSQKLFPVRKRSVLYAQLAIICKKNEPNGEARACDVLLSGLKDNSLLKSDVCELVYRAQSYMKKAEFKDTFNDIEHLFKEAPIAEKFPTITISALSRNANEPIYKYITTSGDTEYLRVEDIAIRHYVDHTEFDQGLHCEGSLISTLFFLHFWDIIFSDTVACSFVGPIQRVPLDFFGKHFYQNRKEAIEQRLEDIESGWSEEQLRLHLTTTWLSVSHIKHHISSFVVDDEFLLKIVSVLTREILAGICKQLAMNFSECHAGMPDLFLWNDTKCKFVEVKGPGDKLSTKQKLWIDYLLKIGADAEVCYVRRIGSRR